MSVHDDLAPLRTAGLQYSLFGPNVVTTPKVARDQVRAVLTSHHLDHLADTAVLLTSELVTNAYLHTRGDVLLRVLLKSPTLRVTVYDDSPRLPELRPACHQGQFGRGMFLVETFAARWGHTPTTATEPFLKGVWFELAAE